MKGNEEYNGIMREYTILAIVGSDEIYLHKEKVKH